jgi:flagellar assembly factor FliW
MKIKTKYFGEIEIPESETILFPFGIYGFEECNRFVLLHDEEDDSGVFMYLQSAEEEILCFIVMEPEIIAPNYSPKLPDDILRKIGADENDKDGIRYIVMSIIREDISKSTVNLLGPIVINTEKKIAMQVVLDPSEPQNGNYKTKHNLFLTLNASSQDVQTETELKREEV